MFVYVIFSLTQQSAFLRVDDEYSLAHIKKGAVYLVGGIQRSEDQDRMLKTLIRVGSELKEQLPDVSPATIVNHRSYVKDVVDQMIEAADS